MVGRNINDAVTFPEEAKEADDFLEHGCRDIVYIPGDVDVSCEQVIGEIRVGKEAEFCAQGGHCDGCAHRQVKALFGDCLDFPIHIVRFRDVDYQPILEPLDKWYCAEGWFV